MAREQGKTVTQVDIAAVAKCSQNTVALSLRGSKRISKTRRQEIVEIARQMGYRPNMAARSLRRGRSGLIGIFTGDLDDPRTAFAREMMTELHSVHYKPVLGLDQAHTKPWYNAPWIETFLELQVEALISFAWHDVPCLPDWHDQVPIILSGNEPDDSLPCDAVSTDRRQCGQLAVEHLIAQGHRRIAMVQRHSGWQYTKGYEDVMNGAGLEPRVFRKEEGESDAAHHRRFVAECKRAKDPPTAAFVLGSSLAADLCQLVMDEGMRIPDDLAVVGSGYMPWADKLAVPLTTVERPIREIVSTTIQITRNRLENPGASPIHIKLPHRLIVRRST